MTEPLGGNILVTGANRGIGLELVKQLLLKTGGETHVYGCCRDPDRAEALRELSSQHVGKLTIIKLDVTDEASICAAIATVTDGVRGHGLNLLINNAAINLPAAPGLLEDTRTQDMMDVYSTNVVGPFLMSKMCFQLLITAAAADHPGEMSCRRSAIINLSSLLSSVSRCPETYAAAPMCPYRVSKAALNMLTRCYAEELKEKEVLVVGVHPGWVRTSMGGDRAPLAVQDSVLAVLAVMSSLSGEDSGMLVDWRGNRIPW